MPPCLCRRHDGHGSAHLAAFRKITTGHGHGRACGRHNSEGQQMASLPAPSGARGALILAPASRSSPKPSPPSIGDERSASTRR
jgi:hypothetical protein